MFDINLIEFFSGYAYQPMLVYGFIIAFMTASSFGLPIPEEMTLVSAGLVAHMAMNPDVYPPESPGAVGVNLWVLCCVCFFAVIASDFLVYSLGRSAGERVLKSRFFRKLLPRDKFSKIDSLFKKYGAWASGIFRFTPGVRFPGHLSCGMMKVPISKFLLIDGMAALISVPTQVLLVAYYGEVILENIKEFKIYLGIGILIIALFFGARYFYRKSKVRST